MAAPRAPIRDGWRDYAGISINEMKKVCPDFVKLIARRGTDNLRGYMQDAILLQVQLGDKAELVQGLGNRRSHKNKLSIKGEQWRRLEMMQRINPEQLSECIAHCRFPLSLAH